MDKKSYTINGKTYTQKPIVLGQLMPLLDLMEGIEILDLSATGLLRALGDKLPAILAVVLVQEGVALADRDLAALEEELRENLEIDTALEVVSDFLSFNPLSLSSAKLKTTMIQILDLVELTIAGHTGSKSADSSASSATETSQSGSG